MKKLRFKNRNGVLYFGIDGKFKSSKLKDTRINRNIIIGKFNTNGLDSELNFNSDKAPTVSEYLDKVMNEKRKTLKLSTIATYENAMKRILPSFNDRLVTNIKPIEIKEFQDMMAHKGLSRSSINQSRSLLREVFDLAILSELIETNPVVAVRVPKTIKKVKKQKPFTLDEVDMILSDTKGHIRNFLGISFFTGMRSGELLALTWDDVDFSNDTISISKTISRGYINSAKTNSSIRDIEMIYQARKFFETQRIETGLKNSYVFLQTNGKTHHGSNDMYYKQFKNALKRLDIEDRSLHNTRHTFASIMLNNSIEPLWVSATLGHKNLDVTLKVYTHYIMPLKSKTLIQ